MTLERQSWSERRRHSVNKLSFLGKFKRQPIFREKIFFTASICWSFFMLGWIESLLGPTLPDLRLIIKETLDTSSWLFTVTSGGFLVGSVLTGVLYAKFDKLLLLILSSVGTAAAVSATPWCPYFSLMMFVRFLTGMMTGSLDTGGNAEMLSIWNRESAPYMQAVHFCFSLGGIIAPLVAQPYLARKIETPSGDNSSSLTDLIFEYSNETFQNHTPIGLEEKYWAVSDNQTNSTVSLKNLKRFEEYGETRIQYAYLITGSLVLITVLPLLALYCMKKDEMKKYRKANVPKEVTDFSRLSMSKKIFIFGLLSLLMVVYCGTEDTFAGFLMTFTISQLKWSKTAGSFATSVHWTAFGVARFAAVFAVRFIRTSTLLFIFSVMSVVSFSCLLVATLTSITSLVWIFIGCCGFSMSVIFPAVFTWTNEHVIPVSGKISAMFLTSSSVGIMLFPLLFGYTMEHFSPIWFLYLLIGQSILWIILFTITIIVTHLWLKSPKQTNEVEINNSIPSEITRL